MVALLHLLLTVFACIVESGVLVVIVAAIIHTLYVDITRILEMRRMTNAMKHSRLQREEEKRLQEEHARLQHEEVV